VNANARRFNEQHGVAVNASKRVGVLPGKVACGQGR